MNIGKTVIVLAVASLLWGSSAVAEEPFGDKDSVSYANDLWSFMVEHKLAGKDAIMTRPYTGAPPHGMILELIEQKATLMGVSGELVVKRNYGGDGLTIDDVINNPDKYLQAVTVMFQREDGYDSDNKNWFYAKYTPDGSLMKNPKGMPLAGRVAKGMPTGCIACHKAAGGGDYIFNHDRYNKM
ncbi:MAG: cytochrome P460 family protein [Amphritea sp.]|nr:cytochrome P460 family protein [Amphritea sp.]